jgi:acid phosphatase type 7
MQQLDLQAMRWHIRIRHHFSLMMLPLCLFFLTAALPAPATADTGEKIVYSYFLKDPTTSIRISWISSSPTPADFQVRLDGEQTWRKRNITRKTSIPGSERTLFEVKLTGLAPASSYEIRIGNDGTHMRFRTLPAELEQPIQFITGGDLYHNAELMTPTTKIAATKNPYFAAIGGDWAYADGDPKLVWRWFDLFRIWQDHMVTEDGYLVPFIPAIGNHEVVGGFLQTPDRAPLYFTFFDKPGKRTYFAVDVGNYMSIIVLDSQHLAAASGAQATWLKSSLTERQHLPHVFPMYHVPAWPSFRSLTNLHSTEVRTHWVPLFEEYGISLSFENHDHTFKRTKPIRDNRVDDEGVVYIGDGSWGVSTRRDPTAHERWYIEKVTDDHHFWNIILYPESRVVQAFNEKGDLIDFFEQTIRTPRARDVFGAADRLGDIPDRLLLAQNFPNPFNPETTISFYLPQDTGRSRVRLEVFDLYGKRIATLIDTPMHPGAHTVSFDIRDYRLPSGTYVYRLQYQGETRSRKMQLMK